MHLALGSENTIDEFLQGQYGWLIFNTHCLDEEGWEPMSSVFLDELPDRLKKRAGLKYCRLLKL